MLQDSYIMQTSVIRYIWFCVSTLYSSKLSLVHSHFSSDVEGTFSKFNLSHLSNGQCWRTQMCPNPMCVGPTRYRLGPPSIRRLRTHMWSVPVYKALLLSNWHLPLHQPKEVVQDSVTVNIESRSSVKQPVFWKALRKPSCVLR